MQDFTANTVPTTHPTHGDMAHVETTYPDGIFPHYIVRDPKNAGEYLYIGENHRMATSAATYHNLNNL